MSVSPPPPKVTDRWNLNYYQKLTQVQKLHLLPVSFQDVADSSAAQPIVPCIGPSIPKKRISRFCQLALERWDTPDTPIWLLPC